MLVLIDKVKCCKYTKMLLKIILSVFISCVMLKALFVDGINEYYSFKDYSYQNDFNEEQSGGLGNEKQISQKFEAKGNILNNISLYLSDNSPLKVEIRISDENDNLVAYTVIDPSEYTVGEWNKIGITATKLKRGKIYTINFIRLSGLDCLVLDSGDAPIIFKGSFNGEEQLAGNVAVGFQFTYRYLTLGSVFEISIKLIITVLMLAALVYSIFKIEDLVQCFVGTEKKQGFGYALYFGISLVLLYNPLETITNEVTEFSRVIGAGIVANVDVSKRISNFSNWFILFAVIFSLYFMLANYWLRMDKSECCNKMQRFLNNFVVLANCCLLLRCITYFNDESASTATYYFSAYMLMIIAMVAIIYIVLRLDKHINIDMFSKLMIIALSASYPIAIMISLEWGNGRVVLGVIGIAIGIIIILCKHGKKIIDGKYFDSLVDAGVIIMPVALIATSFYIELIHILNQYEIFIARPKKHYMFAILIGAIVVLAAGIIIGKRRIALRKWKSWSYSWIIAGIVCLSNQIAITASYNPDLFEGANSSILISDFLNFGCIPIVEHYGGHMMTSVWEGILYGIINNDYLGAIVSPYSSLIVPIIAVFFFYVIRSILNEDIALLVTLLFPFYNVWSYFGLGMLVCVSAMAYVRKNSYKRAVILWLSFIWCALYRLDLGFAFGMAVIISLFIYVVVEKNWKAIKELLYTLLGWIIIGVTAWCVICILKGINPIARLIEFLMINLSNQNWAYSSIGNYSNTVFAWSYIILPFAIVICLTYTIFSKKMRNNIGIDRWILLLIIGWSYFENFSRGLVRHSLAEMSLTIVVWTGYVFLALFVSAFKDNRNLFMPVFTILILCNTLFAQDGNFTGLSFADKAMSQPASIIESWQLGRFEREEWEEEKYNQDLYVASGGVVDDDNVVRDYPTTYWQEIKIEQEVVERVTFNEQLEKYVNKFNVLNDLLSDDETFVDFINKTLIYSMMGKKNPVYVSQSPLQLSGEFTQEEFINEIDFVPIVIMPIDNDNYRASTSLDGITNAYRYYMVAEYIYQNFTPLFKYESDYSVWCLSERYEEFKGKLDTIMHETNYADDIVEEKDKLVFGSMELQKTKEGIKLISADIDPMILELQNILNISEFEDCDMQISIEYHTDTAGSMQIFYTTQENENYNSDKVVTANINGAGTAMFKIPVTQYTRLRLDIPEGSQVEIFSLYISYPCELINYSYDGPYEVVNDSGNVTYSYVNSLHNHGLNQLPRIWAEGDKKNSNNNTVITELINDEGTFVFDENKIVNSENGNYLKITARYDGNDTGGLYRDNDEQLSATVILGYYENNGNFTEKCRYSMYFKEGIHDYLIRCSTDYYWYLGEINAVRISTDGSLHDVVMSVLEGD